MLKGWRDTGKGVTVREQAAENIGWGRAGGGGMWGNVAEAPGKPFSTSGHRLANVLYIHYISKVPHHYAWSFR